MSYRTALAPIYGFEGADLSKYVPTEKELVSAEEYSIVEPRLPTSFSIRAFSPDLDQLVVETSFGLVLGMRPPGPHAFRRPDVADHAYGYRCHACLRSLPAMDKSTTCLLCYSKSPVTAPAPSSWLCESARSLLVDYLKTRETRLGAPVMSEAVSEAISKNDFITDLLEWVEPYFDDPLTAHATAWELADVLDDAWTAWKKARKYRTRRLSAMRILEEGLTSSDWRAWSRHAHLSTGCSVPQ